jgi:hypothetical protein
MEGLVVRTRFGPGFEPVTVIHGKPNAKVLEVHGVAVQEFLGQFETGLELVGNVVRWGLAMGSNPVGWVQVGLKITKAVANETRKEPENP